METGFDLEALKLYFENNEKKPAPILTELASYENIEYSCFFKNHLSANVPCKFKSPITDNWNSRKEWILQDKPNFKFLQNAFGEAQVPVANCNINYHNSHKKSQMHFKEFLNAWEKEEASNLYLKDWHFVKEFPNYQAYEVPNYFRSDWLNEYWESSPLLDSDYRFVYMGSKGTWTPLHSDVFGSYSWSANVCGVKVWYLLPPGSEIHATDKNGDLIDDILQNPSDDFPNLNKLQYLKIVQNPGEIIFVPSGWHHQVLNVEDTISINHNWFNGCNIEHILKRLIFALGEVEHELSDLESIDDWGNLCQGLLKIHHGMNFEDLFLLLKAVFNRISANLEASAPLYLAQSLFDLIQVNKTFKKLVQYSKYFDSTFEFVLSRSTELATHWCEKLSINIAE